MAEKKKPQDHKPKTEKPKVEDVDGGKKVTLHGVTVVVPFEAIDDFELLEELHDLDKKQNGVQLPGILRRLVGDQYKGVLDHLRDKSTGRVPIQTGTRFVFDLVKALNPNS